MAIVAVSEQAFSGGQEFAKALAERLSVRYVDSEILVERAAARGGNPLELRAALECAPTFVDRFVRRRLIQILQLQAALAEDIQDENAVCYGIAADLLAMEIEHALRVSVQASHRFRRLQVQELLKFQGAKAQRYLNKCDRCRRRWLIYLFGTGARSPVECDVIVNPEQNGFDATYVKVSEMIRDQSRTSTGGLASIESFVLSTRIKASLARDPDTAHLDIDVVIHDGTATLRGVTRSVEEIDSIRQASFSLPAGITVDLSQIQLGGPDYVLPFSFGKSAELFPRKKPMTSHIHVPARSPWLLAGVFLMLLLVLTGSWIRRSRFVSGGTNLLSLTGVIADSQCGLSHPNAHLAATCVRSCVKSRGAKYVLIDGARILTLANQQRGEDFAGQRVVATGFLDDATGSLRIQSIHAVP